METEKSVPIESMEVRQEVQIPRPPNFLITQLGATIPIQDMSDEQLRVIGSRYTEQLVSAAQEKRGEKLAERDEVPLKD